MFSKTFLLLNLCALALAEPIPQAAATTSLDFSSYSFPTASLESQLSQVSALESIFSGAPTLPASIESEYLAAIPTTVTYATNQQVNCDLVTATPEWFQTLPGSLKSAITSYDQAFLSWYVAHSAAIESAEGTFTAPSCGATVATTAATTGKGATTTSAGATGTGSSTANGSASSGTSKAAAPRATGAVALSAAGLAGVLGLMAAL